MAIGEVWLGFLGPDQFQLTKHRKRSILLLFANVDRILYLSESVCPCHSGHPFKRAIRAISIGYFHLTASSRRPYTHTQIASFNPSKCSFTSCTGANELLRSGKYLRSLAASFIRCIEPRANSKEMTLKHISGFGHTAWPGNGRF